MDTQIAIEKQKLLTTNINVSNNIFLVDLWYVGWTIFFYMC